MPFLLLAVADALIFLPFGPLVKLFGAMGLLFFLPGWALLEAFFPLPRNVIERVFVAIALSYAVIIVGALYAVYLPGTVSQAVLAGLVHLWIIGLQGFALLKRKNLPSLDASVKEYIAVAVLLLLAAGLRLILLGYSEFHEDEVEVVSFASRIIGGGEYAIFLHRKGPAQSLLPLMIWLNTGQVTEFISRFPFAIASILGVAAVFLTAKRLTASFLIAFFAALFMALNGLSVAFGRMVQYQAIILFLGPLTLWAFWLARQTRRTRWIVPAFLLLAVCTLSHYDTFLYYPIVLYLLGLLVIESDRKLYTLGWVALGVTLFAFVVASFYIPYTQDPQFQYTFSYLSESRVGNALFYNNLSALQKVDTVYNSRFSLPLLFGLAIVFAFSWLQKPLHKAAMAFCFILAASTYWLPDFWKIASLNLAFIPWALCAVGGWIILHRQSCPDPCVEQSPESGQKNKGYQIVWLWWLSSFAGYVFLVDKPGTHFYITYPAWAIVAGAGLGELWNAVKRKKTQGGQIAFVSVGLIVFFVLFFYQTILFWHTDTAYRRQYAEMPEKHFLRQVYKSFPDSYEYFGAPRLLGWKTVGWLLENGMLRGDYRSANEIFSLPIWYTYQTPRSCFGDPHTYFVAEPERGIPEIAQNYTHTGNVIVEGQSRIAIYQKGAVGAEGSDYQFSDYAPLFDAEAKPERFANFPPPHYPAYWRFGDSIIFLGFTLSGEEFSPGETIEINLQWQAVRPIDTPYRAFVHLEKEQIWGQHDDDPACRLPANLWRVGQVAQGQFRVTINPATPPGEYPLIIGLYDPDTWQRLPVSDAKGQSIGDSLQLISIKVK